MGARERPPTGARASRRVRVLVNRSRTLIAYRGRREHESERAPPDAAGDRRRRRRSQSHVAEPVGRACVIETPDGRHVRGRHRAAGRSARRGRGAATRPAHGPTGATLCLDPRAVLAPRPHPAVRRRAHRRRRRPGRRRHRGPRPERRGQRHRAAARRGHRGRRSACARTRCAAQLAPYLKHRRTGGPWVVLKLAATLDGRTAAPDGTSQWITGPRPAADAHRLRAESDAVIVGAGTVRADDPALTVRHVDGRDPLRVVLGHAPAGREGAPVPRAPGRPRRGARRARAAGRRSGAWSRAAPPSPAPSTAPAWSTATCSTSRPRCSAATTPARCSPGRARRPSTTCGAAASLASTSSATTCGSISSPRREA